MEPYDSCCDLTIRIVPQNLVPTAARGHRGHGTCGPNLRVSAPRRVKDETKPVLADGSPAVDDSFSSFVLLLSQ